MRLEKLKELFDGYDKLLKKSAAKSSDVKENITTAMTCVKQLLETTNSHLSRGCESMSALECFKLVNDSGFGIATWSITEIKRELSKPHKNSNNPFVIVMRIGLQHRFSQPFRYFSSDEINTVRGLLYSGEFPNIKSFSSFADSHKQAAEKIMVDNSACLELKAFLIENGLPDLAAKLSIRDLSTYCYDILAFLLENNSLCSKLELEFFNLAVLEGVLTIAALNWFLKINHSDYSDALRVAVCASKHGILDEPTLQRFLGFKNPELMVEAFAALSQLTLEADTLESYLALIDNHSESRGMLSAIIILSKAGLCIDSYIHMCSNSSYCSAMSSALVGLKEAQMLAEPYLSLLMINCTALPGFMIRLTKEGFWREPYLQLLGLSTPPLSPDVIRSSLIYADTFFGLKQSLPLDEIFLKVFKAFVAHTYTKKWLVRQHALILLELQKIGIDVLKITDGTRFFDIASTPLGKILEILSAFKKMKAPIDYFELFKALSDEYDLENQKLPFNKPEPGVIAQLMRLGLLTVSNTISILKLSEVDRLAFIFVLNALIKEDREANHKEDREANHADLFSMAQKIIELKDCLNIILGLSNAEILTATALHEILAAENPREKTAQLIEAIDLRANTAQQNEVSAAANPHSFHAASQSVDSGATGPSVDTSFTKIGVFF